VFITKIGEQQALACEPTRISWLSFLSAKNNNIFSGEKRQWEICLRLQGKQAPDVNIFKTF